MSVTSLLKTHESLKNYLYSESQIVILLIKMTMVVVVAAAMDHKNFPFLTPVLIVGSLRLRFTLTLRGCGT